ncbi:MAG: LPS-assembly protein LptD, partial [Burkholderiales bacterium]
PYFMFPLGERKSGFLTPTFGSNTNTGTFVGLPYYWNMAPNYDMTITPEIYSRSGFLISDQFRYLTEQGKGEIYTEQVPNQWSDGKYRYYYHLTDTHNLESNVAVGYNYNQVSDNNYFVDFGNFNSTVDNINLDQSVYANYKPQWGFVGIKAQQFQTLQPTGPSGPVATAPIYSTLPQVNLNIQPQAIGQTPFQVNFISQYSNFYSTAMQSGQRAVIYPSITMPLKKAWGYITPKFGYNYTNYQLAPFPNQQAGYNGINRAIPISSIDSGLYFERPLTLGSTSYAQTLEPRLYYLYIPEVDQSKIPLFDTAPATYNLNQLFSENRFSGYDRINLANDLTMGVTSRLINDNTGVEMANWGIGYRYYITPENDFAYGNYTQYQQLYLPQPNAIAELGNKWTKAISTNASFQYNTMYNEIDAYSLQLKYNPEDYKIVNMRFGYQYQTPLLYYAYTPGQAYTPAAYEDQYVLDLSGQWP